MSIFTFRSVRSRLGSVLRWLAPSAVTACAGALAAGLVEALAMHDVVAGAATAGFLALLAIPALFVAGIVVRGAVAIWRPGELVRRFVDETGAAPAFAAWVTVVWLGTVGLAWAMFQGTWLLAAWTAFKPLTIAFAEPLLAVGMALVILLASRPAALVLTALYRRLDARWQRSNTGSPFSVPVVLTMTALATIGGGYAVWHFLVKPRIGPLDLSGLSAPVAAAGVAIVAQLAWSSLPRARILAGATIVALAAAVMGAAAYVRVAEPTLALEIWGDRPLAGLAIDQLFDLDAIRANVSLAEFRPSTRPGAKHPDIILVTIDTVRADHTPPYGGHAEMPVLRELGLRGAVFEWAFSPSNVTRRSIPSMVIGLQPNRVHGRVVGWALRVDPRHVLLAERLAAGGYDTAGFMCCHGFWSPEVHTGLQRGLEHLEIEPNGVALARSARTWLDARERMPDRKPLFLWMHILEPHNWTASSGEPHNDDERRRYYDRSLAASDAMLVELLGAFSDRAPDQAPIVIVTADHGEGLGEHGQPYHSTDLYDSQTHVPLVMAGPGIPAHRIGEAVSLVDLVPTIVELAGFDAPHGPAIDGRSIADLATGHRGTVIDRGLAFAAMIKDRSNPGGITAIVKGRWKLIDNGSSVELYDFIADPDERSNVISAHPQIADELRRTLKQRADAGDASPF